MNRRDFLRSLALAPSLGLGLFGVDAAPAAGSPARDAFIFIFAAGGWDVTLWSDPRAEDRGLVDPATITNVSTAGIVGWKNASRLSDSSFEPLRRGNLVLGPAMGTLADMPDRFALVNGIATNTVSHPDGTYFASTGRHLAGGRAVASSIDTALAHEYGTSDVLPVVSVGFPSTYVGRTLDPRVIPLRVSGIATLERSLARTNLYTNERQRALVNQLLADEAVAFQSRAQYADPIAAFALQMRELPRLMQRNVSNLFRASYLRQQHPSMPHKARYQSQAALHASFAVEAIRKGLVRSVGFTAQGFDTHNTNYRNHPMMLQELFDVVASLIRVMDATTFDGTTTRLSERVSILVLSEFCRTPQLNHLGGRDHYPNNSALLVSPAVRTNRVVGASDVEQLLPRDYAGFARGPRQITPADVLATVLAAARVPPAKHLREGEPLKGLLS